MFWEYQTVPSKINYDVIVRQPVHPQYHISPSKGKHTKFTLNLRPATTIEHPTQTELVVT